MQSAHSVPSPSNPTGLQAFSFDGAEVRVTMRDGQPWWALPDVCSVLDITNPWNVSSRLDDDEKGLHTMETLGGPQQVAIVNESGLYSLVLTSRKPAAKRFKKWITAEVIPSIRKNGSYGTPVIPDLSDPDTLQSLLIVYAQDKKRLLTQVATLSPKADALDRIATADGSLCVTDAAKTLQVRPNELFKFLRSHSWIYSRSGGGEVAYQDKLASGLLEHKTTTVHRSDGSERVHTQVRVTPKGLTRLAQEFPPAATLV